MQTNQKGNIIIGVLLLLVGGWFLAGQFVPGLSELVQLDIEWPVFIVGLGALFLVLSIVLQSPSMAVPAAILAGLGGIFYYQNQTGDWASWAYMWTLIPGFAGIGTLVKNLLEGNFLHGLREAITSILFSAALFIFFSGILGGPDLLYRLWPVLLIAVGISMLLRNRRSTPRRPKQPEIIEQ
ncbi:MAG: hypothetical protein KIS88_11355 [Anaerolineales bacterium]|nr:hypothetical protein [Anaerolineales bacterium]